MKASASDGEESQCGAKILCRTSRALTKTYFNLNVGSELRNRPSCQLQLCTLDCFCVGASSYSVMSSNPADEYAARVSREQKENPVKIGHLDESVIAGKYNLYEYLRCNTHRDSIARRRRNRLYCALGSERVVPDSAN